MFCPRCGTDLPEDAAFCQRCGRALSPLPPLRADQPPGPWPSPAWDAAAPGAEAAHQAPPARPAADDAFPQTLPGADVAAPGGLAPASFMRRLSGWLIDGAALGTAAFAVYIAVVVIAVIAAGAETDAEVEREVERASGEFGPAIYALLLVGSFVYLWTCNAAGRSLGKLAVGVRVVRGDGRPPGVGKGLGRTVGAWLSGLAGGLGYLWAAWDRSKQTWHDKMAGTFVVRE